MTTSTTTHYDTLGISRDATLEQIKAAWRTVRRQTHPDSGGSDQAFAEASHAYEVLCDPDSRLLYDLTLDGPAQPEPAEDPDVTEPVTVAEDWGAPVGGPAPTPMPAPAPPSAAGPFPAPPRPTRPAAPPRPPRIPLAVRVKAGLKTPIWRWTILASVFVFLGGLAWMADISVGHDVDNAHVFTGASGLPFVLGAPWAMTAFGNAKVNVPGRIWAYGGLALVGFLGTTTPYWVLIAVFSMLAAEAFAQATRFRARRAAARRWDRMQAALQMHNAKLAWCKGGAALVRSNPYGSFAFGNAPAVTMEVRTPVAPNQWVAMSTSRPVVVYFQCSDKDRRAWNKEHGYSK